MHMMLYFLQLFLCEQEIKLYFVGQLPKSATMRILLRPHSAVKCSSLVSSI